MKRVTHDGRRGSNADLRYRADRGRPVPLAGRDRIFFVKGIPPFGTGRTHHVHVRTPEDARAALVFRDHLRRNPDAVERHARLKREREARRPTDREAYTEDRPEFAAEIARGADTRA